MQVYRNDSSESRPPLVHPADFRLVFRINGQSPVTMWEPVPPEGYVALGTVVEGAPQMPDTSEVLCLRADLAVPTRFFDSPIWRWDPPALQVNFSTRSSDLRSIATRPWLPHRVSVQQIRKE